MYLSCQLNTINFNFNSLSLLSSTTKTSTFCCLSNGREKVNGVRVPRQKYIAISKSELLDAIVVMFDSSKEKDEFLLMSS